MAAFMFTSGAPLLHAAHETDGEPGGRLAGVSSGEMSSVNCPANTVIPNGSLASVVGTSFSGSVYIQGLFVVDDDVSFWGAHVYMEAGAQLIVEPNIWLTIIGSTFIACDTAMWKGITVHDGATISISNTSVMEDAEHLVRALDGATVVFMDSQFHNNRVSLYIPPAPGNTWNSVSVYAVNNMFYSQGPMCGPYPGQATTVGQVGFAAVEAHRTYLDLSNGYNLIHTMSNGIVAFNSNVKVEGCEIYIIQPDAAYALPANGSGIYANGMNGYYYLDQKGNGMAGPPNFRNCRWGIYTEYMNVDSRDNHMMSLFGG
ncbi:MAG: hypothetical protein RBT71_06930, partial [Flavobacteriales bacterium]|nr:hypothetical protein [Flavobacteriales bacterium]